ncbi:MAG TPA: UpxY family transcription antiterminator [Candidatus Acidoferrum sp.]|nr:UpxY family transcription antiterminator [Candidatus Acidoferrum sp.]
MLIRNRQWPWFGIQVRTCREKSTNLLLENAGYECFLPVGKCRRRWSDRTKIMEVPLFPGYLFCRMNPNNRLPVLTTPGVIQIVGVGKTPIPIEEEEISAIQKAAMSGLAATPWPYLRVGQTAYITEGPLKGLTGIIIRIKSGLKLVLSINLLQRSVAVEVDSAWATAPPAVVSAPLHAVAD